MDNSETVVSHNQDTVSSKPGMWLFLFIELILFGGLFVVYTVYRFENPMQFKLASMELSTGFGLINSLILLTSSLTVAFSITAIKKGNKFLTLMFLGVTLFFAFLFVINKFMEFAEKISQGLYPKSDLMLEKTQGEALYFGIYHVMTVLHGFHVIAGIVILFWMFSNILKEKITMNDSTKLEKSGLYWHLVVLIWIFIFPLLYLIN